MRPNTSLNLICSLFLIFACTSYTQAKTEVSDQSAQLDQKTQALVNEFGIESRQEHDPITRLSKEKMIINLSKLAKIADQHLPKNTFTAINNPFKGSVCTSRADMYPNSLYKSSVLKNAFYKNLFAAEFELISFTALTYNNKSYDGVFVKLLSKGDDDTINIQSAVPGETGYTFSSFIACDPTTSYKIIKESSEKAILAIKQGHKKITEDLILRVFFASKNVYIKSADTTQNLKYGCSYGDTYDSYVYSDTSANVNSAVATYGARFAPITYVNIFDSNGGIHPGVKMQVLSNNAQDLLSNMPIAQTNQIVYGYKRSLNCN